MWKTILVTDCNYYEWKLNCVYLMKGRRLNQMNRTSVHESRDASGVTAFLSSLPAFKVYTLTHTHTITHTHSHTQTHSHTLSHIHTHTHTLIHTHSRTLSHTHTLLLTAVNLLDDVCYDYWRYFLFSSSLFMFLVLFSIRSF